MRAALAAAVREGRVDPVTLVEESLRRIETHNGRLNAVTALRAEEALAEAAASPRTGALAGLPLLVKDLARCQGMVTTMGSSLFADAPPDDVDDVVVARLKAAGAIVIGRTNSPAFGHAAVHDQSPVRPDPEPLEPRPVPGWVERRFGRGVGRRAGAAGDDLGRRRLGADTGELLRPGRLQAHHGRHRAQRAAPVDRVLDPGGDRIHGRRRGARGVGDPGSGRG